MINFLDTIGMGGVLLLFIVALIAVITLLRFIIKSNGEKAQQQDPDFLVKKVPSVDLVKYKTLIRNMGLVFSLAFVLAAFEYPDFEEQELVNLGQLQDEIEEMFEVPPTEQKPPPPPKITQPEIIEVDDEVEIEEEIEIDLDMEADEDQVIQEVVIQVEEEPEEVADQIFEIVEESAEPKGGMGAFYQWVSKHMDYPDKAKRMGVEGKVYVQFIVDKDGSLTDVKTIRGIGGGCDEEAARLLAKAPKWKPGKQRGRAVKQRMVLPIHFKLSTR